MTKSASSSAPSAVLTCHVAAGEDGRDDLGVQSEPVVETEPLDDLAEVALDLVARGEHSGPVRFRCERELVELRRHIARQTGVAIPVPDSADVGALLQNGEIPKTRCAATSPRWLCQQHLPR